MKKVRCRWCGCVLKPRYEIICKDCTHSNAYHPMMPGRVCVGRPGPCSCTHNYKAREHFERKLQGHGLDAKSLFCTQSCAVQWAHREAGRP